MKQESKPHLHCISSRFMSICKWTVCVNITAKIRDLTTIYSEGGRVKEMFGECAETQNQGSVQNWELICKTSTNGELRFRTTSTSGTNHTQFRKIIFSADRRCLGQLQSSYVAYDGLYTMVIFVQSLCCLFGWPSFDVEFYCVFKRQLNAFEMTEATNWRKELVLKI